MSNEKLRLDKYLWAIRIYKTRTQATKAIDEGKVKLAGSSVKASRIVCIADRYDIKTPARKWNIEVTALLHNRGSYEVANKCYIDQTSEEDKIINTQLTSRFYTGKRLSKTGRPTKKQRRDLSDLHDPEAD